MKTILALSLLCFVGIVSATEPATKKQSIYTPQIVSVDEALNDLEVEVELLAQTIGPQLDPGPPAVTDVERIEALTVKVDNLILQLQ